MPFNTRSSPTDVTQLIPSSASQSPPKPKDERSIAAPSTSLLSPTAIIQCPRFPASWVAQEVTDRLLALKHREETGYLLRNDNGSHNMLSPVVDLTWRNDICKWMFNVVESDKWVGQKGTKVLVLTWEVAAASMSYFDHYFAKTYSSPSMTTAPGPPSERTVLLTSLACLRLATKLYCRVIIPIEFFLYIGRGRFHETELEEMEEDILFQLSWKVHPPTAVDFVYNLLELLPPNKTSPAKSKDDLRERSTKLLKKEAIIDPLFIDVPRSTIAYASILNAAEDVNAIGAMNFANIFLPMVATMFPFLNPNDFKVQECRCRLREIEIESATLKRAAMSGYMKPIE